MEKHFQMITHTKITDVSFSIEDFSCELSHIHRDMEVDLVLEGGFMVRTNDEFYQANPGDVLAFNNYKPHEFISSAGQSRVLTIHIKKSFCTAYFPAFGHLIFRDSRILPGAEPNLVRRLRESVFHLAYNYFLEEFGFELRCYSDLNAICYMLMKLMPFTVSDQPANTIGDKMDVRFNRLMDYIDSHYTERLSLAELAESEGLSVSYLSHFLKERLNMSYQDYLNLIRFEHAIKLLVLTDQKLVDICMESGFSESKYFNKLFQKNYHMKPAEFRRMARESWGRTLPEQGLEKRVYRSGEDCLKILREHYHYICDDIRGSAGNHNPA